ncbi:MAG TPA: hypothetical protein VEL05_05970, partial [Candidatus Acidoferrum sp.]|nr:hypothetical protein [Candidatus Acidoferrum sp.]
EGDDTRSAAAASGDGDEDEASREEDEGALDGSVDDEAEVRAPGKTTPRTTPLLVNAGLSFMGRTLSFNYSGSDASQAPPGFAGTPVPGAYVSGEVYPALFGASRGALANVGVGFVVDRVIRLNATMDDGSGNTVSLPTRMWRYGADLRYRHNFGSAAEPNGYSLQASLGYNTAGFAIDRSSAPAGASVDMPNVNYKYVDAGLGGRIPVGDRLSILAEAKFLAPLDTGSIQEAQQYGGASVLGFDTEAVLEYQITGRWIARAGGRLMVLSYSFDGNGALDDRDQNGQLDVTGASDRYLGGFVTGGYCF